MGEITKRLEETFRVDDVFIILTVVIISYVFICHDFSLIHFKYMQ